MCAVLAVPPVSAATLSFPPDPAWVACAREVVRTAVRTLAAVKGEVVDTAALLTSEVVTNAVVASERGAVGAPVGVRIGWSEDCGLQVWVRDEAPGLLDSAAASPGPEEEHGRGLLLLALQAAEWGVCRHEPGGGKAVWFTLR